MQNQASDSQNAGKSSVGRYHVGGGVEPGPTGCASQVPGAGIRAPLERPGMGVGGAFQ